MTEASCAPGLFRQRILTSSLELGVLPPVFLGSNPISSVYLLAPVSAAESLAKQFGIQRDKHGAFFELNAGVDLRRFPVALLPFFARPSVTPFMSDLQPLGSWNGSLGTFLMTSSLEPFVETATRKFAGKCYMCGAPRLSEKAPAHQARAWLKFFEPANGEPFGRQYLLALTPMCRDCADMFNLTKATANDRLVASLARLAAAFRFGEDEASQYRDLMAARHQRHNGNLWAVDVARVIGESSIEVQASWEHRGEPGLSYPVLYRSSSTQGQPGRIVLCGARYKVVGDTRVHYHR